jgi:hypothetical protein
MNPGYSLCYWNMARLGCILEMEEYEIIGNYEKALKLAKSGKGKRSLKTELEYVQEDRSHLIPKEPVSEDWQVI